LLFHNLSFLLILLRLWPSYSLSEAFYKTGYEKQVFAGKIQPEVKQGVEILGQSFQRKLSLLFKKARF